MVKVVTKKLNPFEPSEDYEPSIFFNVLVVVCVAILLLML